MVKITRLFSLFLLENSYFCVNIYIKEKDNKQYDHR